MPPVVLISIVVALAVGALVAAGMMYYREYAGSKSLDARLDRLTGQTTAVVAESASILREPMFGDQARGLLERLIPRVPSLQRMFDQADFKIKPTQFYVFSALMAGFGALIPAVLRWSPWTSVGLGAVFAILPLGYVSYLRKRRLKKFGVQLGEALELLARALRAGHSLAAAMQTVSTEMPNPIAQEFGRVYEEQNLGLSIDQAMRNLGERVPNMDLKFFVTAVIIQRTTGGDLAEILDKIGYLIRERFKILGMVAALTGEGRMSGVMLIGLPFVLLMLLMKLNYEYVSALWLDPRGQKMSAVGLVMMFIGAVVIRKIINIKI